MDSTPEISVFKCVTGRQNIKQLRRQLGMNPTKGTGAHKPTGKGTPQPTGTADDKGVSPTFTQEQDETIIKMKAENKTWNDIAAAVHKQKQEVQNRFKEINSNKEGGGAGDIGEKQAGGDGEKAKGGVNKQQGDKKESGKKGNTISGLSDENMKTLSVIVTRHNQNIWLSIASEFWDEVGVRVDPEDVKAKFK